MRMGGTQSNQYRYRQLLSRSQEDAYAIIGASYEFAA